MPESKKAKRSYDAPLNSQVNGLRVVRHQRTAHPQAAGAKGETLPGGIPADLQPPEPELVSRLIDFIKKI